MIDSASVFTGISITERQRSERAVLPQFPNLGIQMKSPFFALAALIRKCNRVLRLGK